MTCPAAIRPSKELAAIFGGLLAPAWSDAEMAYYHDQQPCLKFCVDQRTWGIFLLSFLSRVYDVNVSAPALSDEDY